MAQIAPVSGYLIEARRKVLVESSWVYQRAYPYMVISQNLGPNILWSLL